jgi:hypothetical protein
MQKGGQWEIVSNRLLKIQCIAKTTTASGMTTEGASHSPAVGVTLALTLAWEREKGKGSPEPKTSEARKTCPAVTVKAKTVPHKVERQG